MLLKLKKLFAFSSPCKVFYCLHKITTVNSIKIHTILHRVRLQMSSLLERKTIFKITLGDAKIYLISLPCSKNKCLIFYIVVIKTCFIVFVIVNIMKINNRLFSIIKFVCFLLHFQKSAVTIYYY